MSNELCCPCATELPDLAETVHLTPSWKKNSKGVKHWHEIINGA